MKRFASGIIAMVFLGLGSAWDLKAEVFPDVDVDGEGVFMWSGGFIRRESDEEGLRGKSLFSFGFDGCTGVAVYALLKNGEQRAMLTHYPPISERMHHHEIKRLCAQMRPEVEGEIEQMSATIFHPEAWEKDSQTGSWKSVPYDSDDVSFLISLIKTACGCEADDTHVELYSMMQDSQAYTPGGMCSGKLVPKELEVVLAQRPEESYIQTRADLHRQKRFSDRRG